MQEERSSNLESLPSHLLIPSMWSQPNCEPGEKVFTSSGFGNSCFHAQRGRERERERSTFHKKHPIDLSTDAMLHAERAPHSLSSAKRPPLDRCFGNSFRECRANFTWGTHWPQVDNEALVANLQPLSLAHRTIRAQKSMWRTSPSLMIC